MEAGIVQVEALGVPSTVANGAGMVMAVAIGPKGMGRFGHTRHH